MFTLWGDGFFSELYLSLCSKLILTQSWENTLLPVEWSSQIHSPFVKLRWLMWSQRILKAFPSQDGAHSKLTYVQNLQSHVSANPIVFRFSKSEKNTVSCLAQTVLLYPRLCQVLKNILCLNSYKIVQDLMFWRHWIFFPSSLHTEAYVNSKKRTDTPPLGDEARGGSHNRQLCITP